MSIRIAATAAAALALAAPAGAVPLSEAFSSYYVLGDSLSDDGNVFAATGGETPQSPPYFEGRFSDGPVFTDYLAEGFAETENFAFGGAEAVEDGDDIPDLPTQLGLLSQVDPAGFGPRSLATILFGGNDAFGAVGSDEDEVAAAEEAADAVVGAASTVLGFGIDTVAVITLPRLDTTPLYTLFQPDLADEAALFEETFNARLGEGLALLGAEGLDVREIDSRAFFAELTADPAAFGIDEPVLPCLFPSAEAAAALGQPQLCDLATQAPTRAFFDAVHPSGTVHQAFAGYVEAQLTPPLAPIPLPAAGWLLLAGVGGLVMVRRRR